MPTQNIHVLQEVGSLEKLYDEVAKLQKTLRYLLDGQIDFENIRARSIKAENIEVGSLTAEEIKAGTITADKMDVEELSAISANLGTITAGEIYGTYIATSNGIYPLVKMSNTEDLFGAYSDDGVGVEMIAKYISDKPALRLIDEGIPVGHLALLASGNIILDATNILTISANNNVIMKSLGLQGFVFENWGNIYNSDLSISLQSYLDNMISLIDDLDDRVTALGG